MKSHQNPQSATALPTAPEEDEKARTRTYLITMGIRLACLVLMIVITPYGWYSFVFAAGAIFLPYIAVVMANAGRWGASGDIRAVARQVEAAPAGGAMDEKEETTRVWRVAEPPAPSEPAPSASGSSASAPSASGSAPGPESRRSGHIPARDDEGQS